MSQHLTFEVQVPNIHPSEALANVPCLTHSCFQPGNRIVLESNLSTQRIDIECSFPLCIYLAQTNKASQNYILKIHSHLESS